MPVRWTLPASFALAVWVWADLASGREPGWPEVLGLAAWLAALAWASYDLRSQGYVRAVWHGPRGRACVALTFDDGPDPATTPLVLEALARSGAHATFFMVGEKVDRHPELARRVVLEGHEVANHGSRHDWRWLLTVGRARALIAHGAASIERATGVTPQLFRPPYGVSTPALGAAVARTRVRVAGWSVRTRDATGRGEPLARARRVVARARAGDVVLMHDAAEHDGRRPPLGPAMLPEVLAGLAAKGLRPVRLSRLLDGEPAHR